ncbi:MAG: hypothetical protein AAF335_03525 [Bacteroidota bacterium]
MRVASTVFVKLSTCKTITLNVDLSTVMTQGAKSMIQDKGGYPLREGEDVFQKFQILSYGFKPESRGGTESSECDEQDLGSIELQGNKELQTLDDKSIISGILFLYAPSPDSSQKLDPFNERKAKDSNY